MGNVGAAVSAPCWYGRGSNWHLPPGLPAVVAAHALLGQHSVPTRGSRSSSSDPHTPGQQGQRLVSAPVSPSSGDCTCTPTIAGAVMVTRFHVSQWWQQPTHSRDKVGSDQSPLRGLLALAVAHARLWSPRWRRWLAPTPGAHVGGCPVA